MKPLVLIILDGWGLREPTEDNAITIAGAPNISELWERWPHTALLCSGKAVGLPEGQMGNSEVGHLNIGAGRRVLQELSRISEEIENGEFFGNKVLLEAMNHVKKNSSALHCMGLLSDGGVHSHISHLFALLEMAKREGVKQVYLHAFLDGRDTPPISAIEYITDLQEKIEELHIGKIATIMGRYYAMDRDRRWERTEKAYRALVYGEGRRADNVLLALKTSYENKELDEFIQPYVFTEGEGLIRPDDAVIFFNFRPDRARQLTRCFVEHGFNAFPRPENWRNLYFVSFTKYDNELDAKIAFPSQIIRNGLGEVLSRAGLRQLRLAETEKYAHVTFFFNGGREDIYAGEARQLIPSPKVATYDMKPEMSAPQITEAAIKAVMEGKYDVIIMNYANADMVGHTGDLEAAIKAIKAVDNGVGQVVEAVLRKDGIAIVTADHGNAEKMRDEKTGQPHSAHTENPVPFILINAGQYALREDGILADIAPTILQLLNLEQPREMTGKTLIKK